MRIVSQPSSVLSHGLGVYIIQTLLAWASTGFRCISPTIVHNNFKAIQLPIPIRLRCVFESVNSATINATCRKGIPVINNSVWVYLQPNFLLSRLNLLLSSFRSWLLLLPKSSLKHCLNITINYILPKTIFFGLHFYRRQCRSTFNQLHDVAMLLSPFSSIADSIPSNILCLNSAKTE